MPSITPEEFRAMAAKEPKKKRKAEESLQLQVSKYLRTQYPDVIFTSESSGLKLTMGQAVKAKKMRSESGLPDMIILEPRGGWFGLCLELKVKPVTLKDGSLSKDKHIRKQHYLIGKLMAKGYRACFVVGFDEAKKIIDWYMRKDQ